MDQLNMKFRMPTRPWRRLLQLSVLAVLILVPWASQNPADWSPSRIVMGQLPQPHMFQISGDTWSFAIGDFRLTHPVAFLENWLATKRIYLPLLLAAALPLLITVVLGRVFCSWLCPVGFLLEINMKARALMKRIGLHYTLSMPDVRYPFLAICFGMSLLLATPLIGVFDPPHLLGRELMYLFTHQQFSLTGLTILGGIIFMELFLLTRIWCRKLCPAGGCLSLLGAKRLWRITMQQEACINCDDCNHACPYDLKPMQLANQENYFDWKTCDNCGLCRDSCSTGAISYRFTLKPLMQTHHANQGKSS